MKFFLSVLLTNFQKIIFSLFCFAILICSSLPGTTNAQTVSKKKHVKTNWEITPSFKYDTLCFLNALTGDPYYLKYYKKDFLLFEPKLTPKVRKSLANLKRVIKDENKNIISAFLSLHFSATDNETLEDMLRTLKNSKTMKANMKKTAYYNENGWKMYKSVRKDLKVVFRFLQKIRFYEYWKQNILPKVKQTIMKIEPNLPAYNVISEVENHLGYPLESDKITVYMLYYSQPHGIRITGTRFLTDIAWSFSILLRTAIHEMMHPPFDYEDKKFMSALETLKKDSFIMDKVLNHNPAFGYNSFEGYMDENIVKALDQIIGEKLGVSRDARKRFKHSDDGMHVFAAALYSLMKKEGFPKNKETLRSFLMRMIGSGKLSAGKIKTMYNLFYAKK